MYSLKIYKHSFRRNNTYLVRMYFICTYFRKWVVRVGSKRKKQTFEKLIGLFSIVCILDNGKNA